MTTIREVLREAAIAVSLGAGFELISLFLFGLFVVGGARWVLA